MSFETTLESIRTWLECLNETVAQVNAPVTDGVTLTMPRSKDLLVTFNGDEEGRPEQLPAIVVQLEDGAADMGSPVAGFKGNLLGTMYLVDEAGSMVECRTKLARWIDALNRHCSHPTAIMGSFSRVRLSGLSFNLGKDQGEINTLVLKADLVIPTTF